MPVATSHVEQSCTPAGAHGDLRWRAGMAALQLAGLAPLTGWPVAGAWAVSYVALQILTARRSAAGRARLALTGLESAVFGALALAAVMRGGAWGAASGVLFLSAGLAACAIRRPARSVPALAAAVAPYLVYLMVAAAMIGRLSGSFAAAVATAIGGGLVGALAVLAWRMSGEALERERRMRAEAERRKREADVQAGAKSAFVAALIQELRTPLSAIAAGAKTIEHAPGADLSVRSNTQLIAESGRTIQAMLEDLAGLADVEAGRLRLDDRSFDLRAVIAEALESAAGLARRKGLYLRCAGEEGLPAHVRGDRARLRQVLDAMLIAALGQTDQGGVILSAHAARLQPGESREFEEKDWVVRLTVADTGRPFAETERERLFTPFENEPGSSPRAHAAALALALGRELARLMAGDLHAGAADAPRFTFEACLRAAEAPTAVERAARMSVLVVDDHEMNRRAIGLMLEPLGMRLTAATSGQAALEVLACTPFDLVIMDVDMPLMDGRETCRRLRTAAGPNRLVPVVGCLPDGGGHLAEDCRRSGMTTYVPKPVDAQALYAAIERAMRAARPRQGAAAA